jgi:dethiobiotin synthetase
MRKIFVTGIGTGIGKTIASAIITEALQADYWKPVQAGLEEGTDTETIKKLVSNSKTKIHPEAFRLKMPASPHAAAAAENVTIKIKDLELPNTTNNIVIEGAGGLMVPLNDKELMIDFIQELNAEVILVVRHYLGSINHTLLSLAALRSRKIPVIGIVFNGEPNEMSEKVILSFFPVSVIGRIKEEINFNTSVISAYAEKFRLIQK